MNFTQKGNICKCKTRHATVGDKKGFIKDIKAFRGRRMCSFGSKPPRHKQAPNQKLARHS